MDLEDARMVNKIYAKKKEFTTQYIMAELSYEKKMIAMEAIGVIKREIGSSYPYCAGSVTMNCVGYDKSTLLYIVNWFLERQSSIVVNYERKQVQITGYMREY